MAVNTPEKVSTRTARAYLSRALGGVPAHLLECPCGCGGAIIYARTKSPEKLWIMPTYLPLRARGIGNSQELADIIAYARGERPDVPEAHWQEWMAVVAPLCPGARA